jgi:hypothetical protein
MDPRGPSRPLKYQEPAFAKTSKNLQFFKVFVVQGRPRQPLKAQEGSQEAPEELQKLKKRDPKMVPKISNFWTNFGTILGPILGPIIGPKGDQKWV